jgi:hypothetical protein
MHIIAKGCGLDVIIGHKKHKFARVATLVWVPQGGRGAVGRALRPVKKACGEPSH